MKTKYYIHSTILLLIVLLPSFITQGMSQELSGKDGPVIEISRDTLKYGPPRAPRDCPFFAEYETGNVLLGSTSSIGIVTVEVSSTAGDYYVSFFDTFDREILLPVSGNPGYYLLRIAVSSNEHYIGHFEL